MLPVPGPISRIVSVDRTPAYDMSLSQHEREWRERAKDRQTCGQRDRETESKSATDRHIDRTRQTRGMDLFDNGIDNERIFENVLTKRLVELDA